MDAGLLDTLVKLASLGASGVCIFALFWIGWLIWRLPADATPERYKTLRMFMIIAVFIALISGATGLVNAKFNAEEIHHLREQNQALKSDLQTYREREIETKDAAKALGTVLKSKEAYNLLHPSEEIKTHIDLLKNFLAEMGVEVSPQD